MLSTRSVQLSVHDVSYRWLVCMQRIVHLIIISGVRALNAAWILFHVSCRLCFPNFIAHIGDYFFLDEANTRFYCLMDHVNHFSLLTSLSFVRTKVKFQVFLNCLTLKKKVLSCFFIYCSLVNWIMFWSTIVFSLLTRHFITSAMFNFIGLLYFQSRDMQSCCPLVGRSIVPRPDRWPSHSWGRARRPQRESRKQTWRRPWAWSSSSHVTCSAVAHWSGV